MKRLAILNTLVCAGLVLTAAFASHAQQTLNDASTKREKNVIGEFARSRNISGGFVLLTPGELAMLGDPCATAAPIVFGQTVNGALSTSDCHLDDGSYADFYIFSGTQGQQITITLSSAAFDTYLGVANETGTWVVEDDDGGGGTNSRIVAALPETGNYIILANSVFANAVGPYALSLTSVPQCTYSFEPASADLPGNGGTYSFFVNTQPNCSWTTSYDIYSFVRVTTPGGTGPGTVTYTADPNAGSSPTGSPRSTVIRINNTNLFTVNQAYLACSYSISPTSASHGPDAGTYEFQMNTAVGCPWIAYYDPANFWLWTTNELKRGPGPVVYTVAANNGTTTRSSTITVQGNTYSVQQTGRGCTYSVSPTSWQISPAGLPNGQFTVDTQAGCTWAFRWSGSVNTYFPYGNTGTGPATVSFVVYPNSQFNTRTWTIQFEGVTTQNITFTQGGVPYRTPFDFFGDSKADVSVFRPSTGEWILHDSRFEQAVYTYSFGQSGDIITPGDYDGDRSADIAVFRPSNGTWYIRSGAGYTSVNFGTNGDIPAPADYDGDGKTDIAVFRPSSATWFILRSSDAGVSIANFGLNGDAPVPADYDGDGKTDIAIWRPSVGEWWYWASASGNVFAAQFGTSTDRVVPGDYTGDGKADIAFWRPSNGYWYILRSEDSSYFALPFGMEGDLPVPADYDADGIIDTAIFRQSSSVWYINRSGTRTVAIRQFGLSGDVPVPGAYVR